MSSRTLLPCKNTGELLVTRTRKWKLMCSHPKHFLLFVLSFISFPGCCFYFPFSMTYWTAFSRGTKEVPFELESLEDHQGL